MSNEVENLKLAAGNAKVPLGIVPMASLEGVARVLEDSACKYAPGNFMAQPLADALSAYDSALLRHRAECQPLDGLVTIKSYAALDKDSGLPTIDHMISGLLILRALMIRDGVLPADPGQGKRKRAEAMINEIVEKAVQYGGQPSSPAEIWRNAHWNNLSAELAPTMSTEEAAEALANAVLGEPLEAGRGPVSCGIVDCRACHATDDQETKPTAKIGATRAEGMRW